MGAPDMHPHFQLGDTYSGRNAAGVDINKDKEGLVYSFPVTEEVADQLGMSKRLIGQRITVKVMRNDTGAARDAGEIVSIDLTAGIEELGKATALTSAVGQRFAYIVDPWLPAAGVADGDLFYAVIGGPAYALAPVAGVGITGGDLLEASASGRITVATAAADGEARPGRTIGTALATSLAAANADSLVPLMVHPQWS